MGSRRRKAAFFVPIGVALLAGAIDTLLRPWPRETSCVAVIDSPSDHGTRIAERIRERCSGCEVISIPVTSDGAGIRASDLTQAIQKALDSKARVINLSLGVTENSPALADVVKRASKRGALVVAAAGHGLPNPFRPMPLSKIFPQAYPEVIVVGEADSRGELELSSNYGPEMSLRVFPGPDRGSSFSAAIVSGEVARLLAAEPGLGRAEILARLEQKAPGSGGGTEGSKH